MSDMFDPTVPSVEEQTPVSQPSVATDVPVGEPHDEANGVWRAEAGRKGAKRVHQLIQAGKLYEEEHGLKSGRQRLRQLIELGKLYEQEHGVPQPAEKPRSGRMSRAERDEVVATLLQCLVRIARPSFRPEMDRLLQVLSPDKSQAA